MKKATEQCLHRKGERNEADLLKLRTAYGCRGYAAYQLLKEYQYDSPSGKLHEAAVEIVSLEWGIPDLKDILAFGVAEGIFMYAERMYWIAVVFQDVRNQAEVDRDLHDKRAQAGRKGAEARARKYRLLKESSADDNAVEASLTEGKTIPPHPVPENDFSASPPGSEAEPNLALAKQNVANFGKNGEANLASAKQNLANFGKSAQPYNKEPRESTTVLRISSSPEEDEVRRRTGATSVHDILPIPFPKWSREQFEILARHYAARDGFDTELLPAFIAHWTGMAPAGGMLFQVQKSWSFENKMRNYKRVEDDITKKAAAHQSINHGKILNPPPAGGPKLRKIGGGADPKTKAS